MSARTAEVKSNGSASWKLSADQGDPDAQFKYAIRLVTGTGVAQNKSFAAHDYKLSGRGSLKNGWNGAMSCSSRWKLPSLPDISRQLPDSIS
jgi:hypothetical protein